MATRNADNTQIVVDATGAINYPVQPAFMAYLSSGATNVTGDGTAYQIICDTEIYDQASNYDNTTGVFTAPVAGRYFFNAGITLDTIGTSNSMTLIVNATGNVPTLIQLNPSSCAVGGVLSFSGSAFINMSATHTAYLRIQCFGTTKTVNVSGQATNPLTWFAGYLAC